MVAYGPKLPYMAPGPGLVGPSLEYRTFSFTTRHYDRVSSQDLAQYLQNTLSFILLQGHQERVRNAAVRCSLQLYQLPFAYAVEGPTL